MGMEPRAMKEIHKIMEKLYEEEKSLSQEEILKRIHESSEALIREKGLKLERVRRKAQIV